jgi:hypothetical protein
MKCICGYEYKTDYYGKEKKITGDEEFIYIIGEFHVKSDDYYHTEIRVSLYACPKCKTVILGN